MDILVTVAIGIIALGIVAIFLIVDRTTTAEERDKMPLLGVMFGSPGGFGWRPFWSGGKNWTLLAGMKTQKEHKKWELKNFNYVFKVYAIIINIGYFVFVSYFYIGIIIYMPPILFFVATFLGLNAILYIVRRFKMLTLLKFILHLHTAIIIVGVAFYAAMIAIFLNQ